MKELKQLRLVFKEISSLKSNNGAKSIKYKYQVLNDEGEVLCERQSNRLYVACYVERLEVLDHKDRKIGEPAIIVYKAPFFFSRKDLIGRGDSRTFTNWNTSYGIAYLENNNHDHKD